MPPQTQPAPENQPGAMELLQLVMGTPDVESYLDELARMATELHSEIGGVGVTLRRDGRALSVATSNSLAASVDELQYGLDTGPCLESLRTGVVVLVEDMAREDRWDGYPAHAAARGVRSSLSLPLSVDGTSIGALNTYGTQPHLFESALAERLRTFAHQAEIALALALRQTQQGRTVEQLHAAMQSRSVIDQALGILMARHGGTADDAFARLRAESQASNQKVRELAEQLVESASGAPPAPGPFQP